VINNVATIGLVVGAGAISSTATAGPSPLVWAMPLITGVIGALLVRAILLATPSKKKRAWLYETLVTVLSMMVTGVAVSHFQFGIFEAMWTGMGLGALGVGIITASKTAIMTTLVGWLRSIDPPKDPPK
jgi:hypothetical protein